MKKLRKSGSAVKEKAADIVRLRRAQLEAILGKPKVLDEISFVVGLLVILGIEGVMLVKPSSIGTWYTIIGIPLLIARYFLYRRDGHHFFMLDFCYYAQVLMLLMLWHYDQNYPMFFWLVYGLCTGPLGGGIYMWKNSLVLHDLDRFTSTYIHFVPPIAMYSLRWFSYGANFEPPAFGAFMWRALVLYLFWQALYILKTEIMDRRRFKDDQDLVTSLRWMTRNRPHPIYKWVRAQKWGHNVPGLMIIVTVQLVYTCLTLAPCYLFMRYRLINELWLAFLFLSALWNGSRFYFEILAERELKKQQGARATKKKVELKLSSTKTRFATFLLFLTIGLVGNSYLIQYLC